MILYVNGCSHTAGHCVPLYKTYSNIVMASMVPKLDYNINTPYFTETNFSNFLYNDALHGAGNDYIFHKTIESITHLMLIDKKPNYVIIQWTGVNRRINCFENGKIQFVTPHSTSKNGILFEPVASEHSLHFIFTLQEFLKKNDIEYSFFNYMALDECVKKSPILPLIDLNKFIDFGNGDFLFEGLIDFFKLQNLCCDEQGHPNEKANLIIANKITDKLNINIIDDNVFLKNKLI
jgi:hypothetical protein